MDSDSISLKDPFTYVSRGQVLNWLYFMYDHYKEQIEKYQKDCEDPVCCPWSKRHKHMQEFLDFMKQKEEYDENQG